MKDVEHILRVAAVFLVVIVGFLVARAWLVPPSYGDLGRYRAASVDEIKALPIKYAGKAGEADCATCHKPQVREKASSSHRTLACETCHGPLHAHISDPAGVKPLKPKESEIIGFCLRCHEESLSKPPKFPTVNPMKHNPDVACVMCHKPHAPKL